MKIPAAASLLLLFIFAPAFGQSTSNCINFPSGFVPFSSISYVTAANSQGDHLVVGVPAAGALAFINANIPLPAFTNQTFCGQVQLAPQQIYSSVYVPTAAELSGNFGAFSGLLVNPTTGAPYAEGVIPASQLTSLFAWRIGAAQATASSNWTATGSMLEGQTAMGAAVLPSGKVLVADGDGTSEIYDPVTGTFSYANPMLFSHGSGVTATLLENGQVLIVGGDILPSATELYDPPSGQFLATGAPVQPHGGGHTATLLNDGRVLIVGGFLSPGFQGAGPLVGGAAGAETYDLRTGTFTAAGAMFANRVGQTATLLTSGLTTGKVLVAGGFANGVVSLVTVLNSAEIYDPSSGNFSSTSPMTDFRTQHVAVPLPSGEVLLAAGTNDGSAELFNPATLSFAATGMMNLLSRTGAQAALLSSGQVLVAGGANPNGGISTASAELYTPATGTFVVTGSMQYPRLDMAMVPLNGGALAIGGENGPTNLASAEIYTPTLQGLVTSQSGLTFQFAQGNTSVASQTLEVLSSTATIPWTVSVHTYEGGNWLTVGPTSGNSIPGAAFTNLIITANSSGLGTQDYYGSVTLTPTDGVHPPVSIAIVLHIVPAGTPAPPVVLPTGLIFVGLPGQTLNPQNFNVTNLTSSPVTFTAIGSNTPRFFSFSPSLGTIPAASTATFTVTPNLTGITAGVYFGNIQLAFGAGSTQTLEVLLVVSPAPAAPAPAAPADVHRLTTAPACTPNALLPVFTSLGTGFSAPTAWPVTVTVDVVDNCGNQINSGNVIVSFTDGDAPVSLLSTGAGNWTGTWVPVATSTGVSVRADAQSGTLAGSVSVSGQVSSNAAVPVVSQGGVVSSIDFSSAPSLGLLVSIFGSGFATNPVSAPIPLPTQLGSTQVVLAGQALPLLYVSDSLINVLIPYDLAVNVSDQLVVENGSAYSVPVATAIFGATPAIISENGSGSGQGDIFVIGAGGGETLADENHPATAGNAVVIYCVGLGAVTPTIMAGQAAPGSPLSQASNVTVTFGGVTVSAGFAGLTPGETGLYQINATIPAGVPTGNQVPVTIAAGAASSSAAIYMAIQ